MIERQNQPAGPANRFCGHDRGTARMTFVITGILAVLIAIITSPAIARSQDAKPQQASERAIRTSMHNVKYRFAENVSVQINDLTGSIVPIGEHQTPVFDDKESFKVHIESAEVAISPQDVANLLNQIGFSRPGSQLSFISGATTMK